MLPLQSSFGRYVVHALWECPDLSSIWEFDALWLFRRTKKILKCSRVGAFHTGKRDKPGVICHDGVDHLVSWKSSADQQQTLSYLPSSSLGHLDSPGLYSNSTCPKDSNFCYASILGTLDSPTSFVFQNKFRWQVVYGFR